MTVAEWLKKNEELRLPDEFADGLMEVTEIWSTPACFGYCIRAMEIAGFDEEHIRSAVRGMHQAFNELTIKEATELWMKSRI